MIRIKSNREKEIMHMANDKFITELNLVITRKSKLPKRLRDLVIQKGEWLLKEGHIRLDEKPTNEILRVNNELTPTPH